MHHDDKFTSSGPDLLLSYHDNDHYNSVRLNNDLTVMHPVLQTSSKSSTMECFTDSCLNSDSATDQNDSKNISVLGQIEKTSSLNVDILDKPEDEEVSSTDTDSSGNKTSSTESDSSTTTTAATSVGTVTSCSANESSASCSLSSTSSTNISVNKIPTNLTNQLNRSKSWDGGDSIKASCKCADRRTCRKCRKSGVSRRSTRSNNVAVSNNDEKRLEKTNYFSRKKSKSVERYLDSGDDGDDEDDSQKFNEGQFRIMKI
jgi:hypothetical protein